MALFQRLHDGAHFAPVGPFDHDDIASDHLIDQRIKNLGRIRAMHAQRLYNDRKWPNPIVLKITGAKPAFTPPEVSAAKWRWDAAKKVAVLEAELKNMSNQTALEVGFEYRSVKGLDLTERSGAFTRTALLRQTAMGKFTAEVPWKSGDVMEYRAVVRHPLLEAYSIEQKAEVK